MLSPDAHMRHSHVRVRAASRAARGPVRIRLIRKLAEKLDGIDLSAYCIGDVFEAPRYEAELLIAEDWAVADDEPRRDAASRVAAFSEFAVATTSLKRRTIEQLRCVRDKMAVMQFKEQAQRRAEDRIRDELHDEHAKTVTPRSTI